MKIADVLKGFVSAAGTAKELPEQVRALVPVLPDVTAMYASATEKVEEVQEKLEAKGAAIEKAAVTYAAATLTLQAIAAFSTALIAYKLWRKK